MSLNISSPKPGSVPTLLCAADVEAIVENVVGARLERIEREIAGIGEVIRKLGTGAATDDPLEMIDARKLAQLLDVGIREIRRMVRAGEFPEPCRLGARRLRWRRRDVETWIRRHLEGVAK